MAVHLKIDETEVQPVKITGDMFLALLDMQELDKLKFAELIDGVLVDTTPANNRHGLVQGEMLFAIRSALPDGFSAFIDPILRLGPHSLVGPDIAVLRKGVIPEEYPGREFLLCVEISDTSLSTDLRRKAELCGASANTGWSI